MNRLAAIALGVALTTLSPLVSAQTAAQAKRFGAAQKLYDQGAYTPAHQEFAALAAETGSPNAEIYVARCLRELGRLPEAYEAMSLALRHATAKAEAEPKYAATRNSAAAELALLEPKVGKVVIAVVSPPAGLEVTLDGRPLASSKLGVPVATPVGEVAVRLVAPGNPPVERRVKTRGGESVTVTIALGAAAPAPVAPPPPKSAPPAPVSPPPTVMRGGGARIGGFVTLGLGVAGMATFAAAGLMANSRFNEVNEACGGKRCTDPSLADKIDGGRKLDIIANVGLGVGIAGIAVGTLLVALGGPKRVPATSAWILPGGGGVTAGGTF